MLTWRCDSTWNDGSEHRQHRPSCMEKLQLKVPIKLALRLGEASDIEAVVAGGL